MSMPEFRETIRSHLNLPDEKLSSGELALVEQLAKKVPYMGVELGEIPAFTERKEKRFSWGRLEVQFDVHGGVVRECRIWATSSEKGRKLSKTRWRESLTKRMRYKTHFVLCHLCAASQAQARTKCCHSSAVEETFTPTPTPLCGAGNASEF